MARRLQCTANTYRCDHPHQRTHTMHTITNLPLYLALGPDLYNLLTLVGEA